MSYVVIARRWRPQGFDDLVGQEAVVKTFKNALASEKIAHAYLFSGPRGVGKTSSARILAKALNCTQRADSEPCGNCDSCKAITEGASVDVFEIDGASNTSVDSIRELRDAVKYAPSGGKYKIYIIDEVHMLSTAAFNALLKTLEEPPPHVIFIFATTEAKKIPSTILSRCQHHSFRRINRANIKGQLKKITDNEEINISDPALDMIAKAADGSMRDGLTLLDQAYSFTDEITEKELQSLLGLPEAEILLGLSRTILSGNISETFTIIKELTDRGSDLRQIARELVEYFRNIAILKVTTDAEELLEFTEEEAKALREMSVEMNIQQLTLLLTELLKLETEVRNSINPRYTLELGLLRTSFVKGMTSVEDILKMIGDPGDMELAHEPVPQPIMKSAPQPAPKPQPASKPFYAPEPVSEPEPDIPAEPAVQKEPEIAAEPEIIAPEIAAPPVQQNEHVDLSKEDILKKLVDMVDPEDHLLACKLAEAKAVRLTQTDLSIGFAGGMFVLASSIEKNMSVIRPMLQQLSGKKLNLKILTLPNEKNGKDIKELKEEVFADPLVKSAMKVFGAALLNVKPLDKQ